MTAARRTQLVRLGVWVTLATVAVLTTVLAARTETGIRRLATLIAPEASEPTKGAKAPQLAARQFDQDAEQRRMGEAIRSLAADRDRLATRLTSLERNLEDVTGSIPRDPPAAKQPAPQAMPAAPVSSSALPQIGAAPPAASAPPAQPNAPPGQSRVAAGHLATGVTPPATESTATKTEFGVDVGTNTSIEGLRSLWANLKTSQPALFEGLRPIIAVRDGQKPGVVELRLIAGPLPNASIAARLCAALAATNQACQPTVFDGQKLALQ